MNLRGIRRFITRPLLERLAVIFPTHAELDSVRSTIEENSRLLARSNDENSRALARSASNITETSERLQSLETLLRQIEYDLRQEMSRQDGDGRLDRQAIHDLLHRHYGTGRTEPERTRTAVGIVMPTCDRASALRRALASLAEQTHKPDRVMVVNDGRMDVSAIIDEFHDQLPITLLQTPAPYSGSSLARNIALDALDTTYVAFLDDDNLMWPFWIEKAATLLDGDSKVDILYGAQLRDAERSITSKNWFLVSFDAERLKQGNFIDLNQIMHRRSAVRFNSLLRRLVDWDYVLRLVAIEPNRIVAVDAIASVYSTSESDRISVRHWPPDLSETLRGHYGATGVDLPHTPHCCSCCGREGELIPAPRQRPHAQCPQCHSFERHRFLLLFGPFLRDFWIPQTRARREACLIEFGPSQATARFRDLFGRVITIDDRPEADECAVDVIASLTDLPVQRDVADVVVALNSLECVMDIGKTMIEIARVLTSTGIAIIQAPISGHERIDGQDLDTDTRGAAHNGKADHVRLYGTHFYTQLIESGLTSVAVCPRESMLAESIVKYELLSDEALVFAVRSDSSRAITRLKNFTTSLRKGSVLFETPE